jgi:hypothetical protein
VFDADVAVTMALGRDCQGDTGTVNRRGLLTGLAFFFALARSNASGLV